MTGAKENEVLEIRASRGGSADRVPGNSHRVLPRLWHNQECSNWRHLPL